MIPYEDIYSFLTAEENAQKYLEKVINLRMIRKQKAIKIVPRLYTI